MKVTQVTVYNAPFAVYVQVRTNGHGSGKKRGGGRLSVIE